ncbi:uncharacterized protein LOC135681271 isoform X2 [Rhopilema esculentum]|uniref:uncharacterized protein LOC135681271 isoform X2 n=1 Tax=Rhopilema esculentum TaxID=499914 RepID=UPI0031E1B0CB
MDVSGNKMDSNVTADTEGSTYLLSENQQRKGREALNSLVMPIQVASPMDSMQQEQPVPVPKQSVECDDINVEEMNEKLRQIHKDQKEGWKEKKGCQGASHPGALDPENNATYRNALNCVPKFIVDIKYIYQAEMAELLNKERDDRFDYRMVAAYLDFTTAFINTVKKTKDPMMSVFESASRIPGANFIDALLKCKRFDVMEVIVKYYFKAELRQSMSHEEKRAQFKDTSPLAGSVEEKLLRDERNRASSDPVEQVSHDTSEGTGSPQLTLAGRVIRSPSTPHDESSTSNDDYEWDGSTPGAKTFWNSIECEKRRQEKKLKNVEKAFKELFKNDKLRTEFPYTWKLIVHTLRLDPASSNDQYVTPENFRRMLAFFGSPSADDDSCIRTAGYLRQKSQRVKKDSKEKISWFAGIMDQDDAARVLEYQPSGSFLVRFSTSFAKEGWYALAVKTEEAGVVHVQIEQRREGARRLFNVCGHEETTFHTLWDLVNHYELNRLVLGDHEDNEEVVVYLASPCPGLPLNDICKGYKKAKRR